MTKMRRLGINGNKKGKQGELEVAHLFQKYGYPAERGQQHDGLSGSADVVGVPYIWIEVKRKEHLDLGTEELMDAMEQAERDSLAYYKKTGTSVIPVVIHRRNWETWRVSTRMVWFRELLITPPFATSDEGDGMVTMTFEDWMPIYEAYREERERE